MGEVIHANFGQERDWSVTREKTVESLKLVGKIFGDSEQLMESKAECVYALLREMVEDVPSVQVTVSIPESSPQWQADEMAAAVGRQPCKVWRWR